MTARYRLPGLGLLLGALLVACGDASTRTAPSSVEPVSTTASPTAGSTALSTTATADPGREVRARFEQAAAARPELRLEACAPTTPLEDKTCGAALTAAKGVVDEVAAFALSHDSPVVRLYAEPVSMASNGINGTMSLLSDGHIPCYGLNDAPPPPPPLHAEAQDICADGADIIEKQWNIFHSLVTR